MDPDKQQRIENERRQQESAADLVRGKLKTLYADEPNAGEEIAEVEALPDQTLSKHQRYMKEISSSGRSLAEIQTAWHEYYGNLSDTEKHEVWQEFYSKHALAKQQTGQLKPVNAESAESEAKTIQSEAGEYKPAPKPAAAPHPVSHNTAALAKKKRATRWKRTNTAQTRKTPDLSAANDIRQELISKIQTRSKAAKNPHVRALAFGLTMGSLTIFVMLFGFFNERFITPFIRPSGNVSATPIIVGPGTEGPVGPESKIIIPKVNVEAPVVYDVPSIAEADVQKGLEDGVVHYPTTPEPGEKGNAVIFGHSSSNILNKGKYKFAFLLLKSLEKEDTFIVQKDGKRYVYKVYNKYVTSPEDLSVLGPNNRPATMTLITCDPPGTSTNRLIIQAEQIFPDPSTNTKSSAPQNVIPAQEQQLPSNSVTMWQRVVNWF